MLATLISSDSGLWFVLGPIIVVTVAILGGIGSIIAKEYVYCELAYRFARKARDGRIKVEWIQPHGELIRDEGHWVVTPDTGLNRGLLEQAVKLGLIKRSIYGEPRYNVPLGNI